MRDWADSYNSEVDGSDACPSFDNLILLQDHILGILELARVVDGK